jgi:streptomycin 3"-adenylyltransferase
VDDLLRISGRYPAAAPPRPIELTIVVRSEVHPWRFPPQRDFQYGEWWRERFERHDPQLWRPVADPDLAILCMMVLSADAPLTGPSASHVIDAVPRGDFVDALLMTVPGLDVTSDTRNVVLTLARIWSSLVTGRILAKDEAAEWAMRRLPAVHRPVLARARQIYLGTREEEWDDLRDALRAFADSIVTEIRRALLPEPSL